MPATLKPAAFLKDYCGGQAEVEVPDGISISAALQQVGIPPFLVALVIVNQEVRNKEYIIQNGDSIVVLGIVGGG